VTNPSRIGIERRMTRGYHAAPTPE
jgi:hypothetical protein